MLCMEFFKNKEDIKPFFINNFRFYEKIIDPGFIENKDMNIHERADKKNDIQKKAIMHYRENIEKGIYEFEYKPCPVCGSKEFTIFAKKDRYSNNIDSVICYGCGLVQLQPIPTVDTSEKFYSELYTPMYRGVYTASMRKFNSNNLTKMNKSLLRFVSNIGLDKIIKKGDLIVEAGCGDGINLYNMKMLYQEFNYIGYDLNSQYMNIGKDIGLDLRTGYYFEDKSIGGISLLIYHHVFEHIIDLRRELEYSYNCIIDGGYLLIAVPGMLNILTSNLGDIIEKLQNAHLYYFDLDNLIDLCAQFGFKFITGNNGIMAIFKKEKTAQIKNIIHAKNSISISRYMRHDHKIMYFDIVNKLFKLNKNKDYAIVIDSLLRHANPYTGKVMVPIENIDNLLGKRKKYLNDALKLLNIFLNVKCSTNYIHIGG